MKKSRIIIYIICLIGFAGCSDSLLFKMVVAPQATIERDVKGHEQIYSIQAILRLAQKRSGENSYSAYDISTKTPPLPIYQEISFSKDNEGKISINSERKAFDVIKSKDFYYALELKYYDVNGRLINHQFSGYDLKDKDNSTLPVHQHFFTVQNYSLDGSPLTFPMTLDSLYYDKYLFRLNNGEREESSLSSPSNVYVPVNNYIPGSLRYKLPLALKASENSLTKQAILPYTDPKTGIAYRLYKTIDIFKLNEMVPEIFTYEYRDTDPVEEVLGNTLNGYDDLGRLRLGGTVIRLRQERSLLSGAPLDALGFKGMMQFHQSNIAFQMRICICHIITPKGKYDLPYNEGGVHKFNELSPSWNSFDIDYPVPFRIIADADDDHETCIKNIQRYYSGSEAAEIRQMLWDNKAYFERTPQINM